MCYAFELEYYRKMEEARKALEEQQRKDRGASAPAKPAEADQPGQEQQPVAA
jgi:hypothetical protein